MTSPAYNHARSAANASSTPKPFVPPRLERAGTLADTTQGLFGLLMASPGGGFSFTGGAGGGSGGGGFSSGGGGRGGGSTGGLPGGS